MIWLDTELFFLIHSLKGRNGTFDLVMDLLSHPYMIAAMILPWAYQIIKRGKSAWQIKLALILTLILCVGLSDAISFFVLKPMINRARPCIEFSQDVNVLSCGSYEGCPSNHAANTASMATILSSFHSIWWAMPILVGYSRVHQGVHYPGDVLLGWIVGYTITKLTIMILDQGKKAFKRKG